MAMWDLLVIGGGAAGLSAAAAAAGAGLRCLLLDRMGGGGELMNLTAPLHAVADAPTGPDLAARLLEQALVAGAELGVEEVTGLAPTPGGWRATTPEGQHDAASVILAVGLAPGRLGVPGEEGFEGRGLSHCAACDGPLYRGQDVVVAGAGRWAVQEALDLLPLAGSVALVTQGATPPHAPGIRVVAGRIAALDGEAGLEAVLVEGPGGATRLPARAVFVQHGRVPAADFVPADVARDAAGRLQVDQDMRCSLPGLFAAGEARTGFPGTLEAAMADGRRAAASLPRG